MRVRGRCVTVRLTDQEYDRLKVLADAAHESMQKTFRRILHEKLDDCIAGNAKPLCEGWVRAEKLRGAMLGVVDSIHEVLERL